MRVLLASLLLLAAMQAALAERREALVFGASQYHSLRPLSNAGADARSVKAALEALHFRVVLQEERSLVQMRSALRDFTDAAAGADVALVFFSGHGVEMAGDNRLLPVDADAASLQALESSTLPLEEVRVAVAATGRVGLIVLDACRSNPFGARGGDGRGAVALSPSVRRIARPGLGRVGRAENILFAFSAAPGQTALDGTGANSPFTAALVRYLATDGLEIRSVLTLVQQAVYDETRGAQLPYVESGLPATFFASATREQLPERERLLLAMADVTPALRAEVEGAGAQAGVPLAPLFGALLDADLARLPQPERTDKLAEAAQAFGRTRDELRRLASGDPEVTRLRKAAERSLSLGSLEQARDFLSEAAAIDARSTQVLANNLVERRLSEAATHEASAGVARTQLDYAGAIRELERAAALHAAIEREEVPDAARGTRNWLLADLGDLYMLTGDTAAALDAFERMFEAAQLRVENTQGQPNALRNVAVAASRIGTVKAARGDLTGALDAFRAGLAISKQLAASDPDNAEWQRDVSVSQEKIGNVKLASGDLAGALKAFEADLAIAARLAQSDPANADRQRDLSVSHEKIADLKLEAGDLAGALAGYDASLGIRARLAQADPGNEGRQRDMSVSQSEIGSVKALLGDRKGALEAFRASFRIAERLAESDPDNAGRQRDLIVAHVKLAEIGSTPRIHFQAALAVAARMQERGLLAPPDAFIPEMIERKLAALGNG